MCRSETLGLKIRCFRSGSLDNSGTRERIPSSLLRVPSPLYSLVMWLRMCLYPPACVPANQPCRDVRLRRRSEHSFSWSTICSISFKPAFSAETKVFVVPCPSCLRTFFTRGFASTVTGKASFRHELRMSLESTWFDVGLLLPAWILCPGDYRRQCEDWEPRSACQAWGCAVRF